MAIRNETEFVPSRALSPYELQMAKNAPDNILQMNVQLKEIENKKGEKFTMDQISIVPMTNSIEDFINFRYMVMIDLENRYLSIFFKSEFIEKVSFKIVGHHF